MPVDDWRSVVAGRKTEFRGPIGKSSALFNVPTPTLCVAYTVYRGRGHDERLMLLEDVRQEQLGAISPESLTREGFTGDTAFEQFRRYWMARDRKLFQPTRKVFVYRLRPIRPGDIEEQGERLVSHLYGDFLP